jgi:hypothetical protein
MTMNRGYLRPFLVCLLSLFSSASVQAQENTDWPQFRGPGGQGVSKAKGLPTTWSQAENLVWKTELPGPGTSSPIVFGDKIYLTCYTGYNVPGMPKGDQKELRLHLMWLDRKTGKIERVKKLSPKLPEQAQIRENHGYASSTPTIDKEHIYCFFGKTGVFAFDHKGDEVWRADVGSELNGWGSATSPILYGDVVIVNASVESESLVALDKKTGKEVWRVRGVREAWNTPVLVPLKDGKTELVVSMPGKVMGFDPANGDALWTCNNDITWYIVPTIVAQDGVLWSLGGRSGILGVSLRAGGRGDVTKTHRVWTSRKGANVPSPILHEGHLYWMSDSQETAYCADAKTGNIVYEERISRADQVYGSPVMVDGKIYYTNRNGKTFVVAAKPTFELLATNDLRDRGMFNASPAVTGSRLLIRSDKYLYCLGSK